MISLGLNLGSGNLGREWSTEAIAMAQWAEDQGFRTVWVGEGGLGNNAVILMTLIAANTNRISIGSGVLPYRTRNVALLSATFKMLDDLAPGRMKMGLGPWWEPLATQAGLPNEKPLKAMREVVTVAKQLLADETVSYDGEFVNVDNIRFDRAADDSGRAYAVPIYIGAVRMKMVQLAGEIADGVLLDFLLPPSYNLQAMESLKAGAAISGRSIKTIDVPQLVACSVDDGDPASAVDDCRAFLTKYIAQQAHITEFCGADPELIATVKAEIGWPTTTAQIKNAMHLVPDELVKSVSACGTATDALDMVERYIDAGCTEAVLMPLGGDPHRTLEQIGGSLSLTASLARSETATGTWPV